MNIVPIQLTLPISNAAEHLDVSVDTIRRWEKKGLIRSHRDALNHRAFSIDELARVKNRTHPETVSRGFHTLVEKQKTQFTAIELFAGAGGLALGLENAGLKTKTLIEWDRDACITLRVNRPDWDVRQADVSSADFTGMQADVVLGGFPCQAFSYAGQKRGFEDTRGTLFFDFARCVDAVKPRIFVGENVRGLLRHDNGRTLGTMVEVMTELGYRVEYRVLKAQYFDVAQKRERLVIVGIRNDLKIPHVFPKENDYLITVRDALHNVPASAGQQYPAGKKAVLAQVPEGGYWRALPESLQRSYMGASYFMGGGKTGMARRLAWDEPSLTLTCSPAQKQTERCHPAETRPLTVREYARIQSFPDSWQFAGSTASQYKQIGNAVPVNLGYHIGKAIISMLSFCEEPSVLPRRLRRKTA
jgi:DNA (cytosine-5)-methyltransferase 1